MAYTSQVFATPQEFEEWLSKSKQLTDVERNFEALKKICPEKENEWDSKICKAQVTEDGKLQLLCINDIVRAEIDLCHADGDTVQRDGTGALVVNGIKDRNSGETISVWFGTEEQFNDITVKSNKTLYIYSTDFEQQALAALGTLKTDLKEEAETRSEADTALGKKIDALAEKAVTMDTAQTISGAKTFSDNVTMEKQRGIIFKNLSGNSVKLLSPDGSASGTKVELPSTSGTLALVSQVQSEETARIEAEKQIRGDLRKGTLVAKVAETTDFTNAEWVSVDDGYGVEYVDGATYEVCATYVANTLEKDVCHTVTVVKGREILLGAVSFGFGGSDTWERLLEIHEFWLCGSEANVLTVNHRELIVKTDNTTSERTESVPFKYRRIR